MSSQRSHSVRKVLEKLKKKRVKLEKHVEVLKSESESCEEYWTTQMNRARVNYQNALQVSLKKLHDLEDEISYYEEKYGELSSPTPSSNIQQVEELKNQFENYKEETDAVLQQKNEEIERLKEKLASLLLRSNTDLIM